MKRIKVEKELCMSCLNCYIGCMAEHNEKGTSIYDLNLEDVKNESRNHLASDGKGGSVPVLCRHCDQPECVYTCMTGAMSKNRETGYVEYDKERCASCFMCVMNCKYGVLKADDRLKKDVVKCDMCNGRDTPRCVDSCPTGALTFEEVN